MPPLVQKVNVSLEQAGFCYRQFPLLFLWMERFWQAEAMNGYN